MIPIQFKRHIFHVFSGVLLCSLAVSCSSGADDPTGKTSLDSPRTQAMEAQGWQTIKMNAYNYADTEIDQLGHFKTVPNACHQDAAGALGLALWNQLTQVLNKALAKPLRDDDSSTCFTRTDDSKLYGTVDLVLTNPLPASHALMAWDSPTPDPVATTPTPTPTAPTPTDPFPWPGSSPVSTPTPTSTPTHTPTHTPTPTPSSSLPTPPSGNPSPSPSPSPVTRTVLENRGDQICTTIQDMQSAKDLVSLLDQVAAIAYKEDCERVP